MANSVVGSLEVDIKLPHAEKAKELLESLCRHIEPVLRRRDWRVLELQEMTKTKNYLRGCWAWCQPEGDSKTAKRISILLRKDAGSSEFLSFGHLMETMLHEITHIIHGRHNASFYRLMDELRDEYNMLLGSGQVKGSMPTTGGYKLGGSKWQGLSQREAAARAAERRLADARAGFTCEYDLGGSQLSGWSQRESASSTGFAKEELWPGLKEALHASAQESALSNKRKREALAEEQRRLEKAIAVSLKTGSWDSRNKALELEDEELQLTLAISASCACCGTRNKRRFL